MAEIFDVLLKASLTTFAGALTGVCIVWVKGVIKRDRVYDKAIKAVAHDSFYRQCRYLIRQENITEDDLENLNYLHDAYKSLGLNGTGEELYRRCAEKPLK